MKTEYNCKVVSIVDLTENLKILSTTRPKGLDFIPGQFAELGLIESDLPKYKAVEGKKIKIIRRAFSIASSPSNNDFLEFYIVKVEGGKLSPSLCSLKAGDPLWLGEKIKGKMTLGEIDNNKDLILVSTGTGLAPFLSMVRSYAGDRSVEHCDNSSRSSS